MFRFRVSSKEKERDMWGTSERKRELAFLSGRTARLSTESVNNNVIIINLFLYIRLREKASSSNARGEATRRRDVDLSLFTLSLSLSHSLSFYLYTRTLSSPFPMCFVSICYGYVLYFPSLSLLQARSPPHDERQRERKGGQNRAPSDVDQKRFAFGNLRDDVLRRVGRFRGDDGGCNQRRGRDDGLLFVLVAKKKGAL